MFNELSEGTVIFLISQALILIGFTLRTYTMMVIKLKELEMRIQAVERQDNAIMEKLETIQSDIMDIKLELQNKADRH